MELFYNVVGCYLPRYESSIIFAFESTKKVTLLDMDTIVHTKAWTCFGMYTGGNEPVNL